MLAGALCRLAADAPRTSPHDVPQLARFLRRSLLAHNAARVPHARPLSRAFASLVRARRFYATTTRATEPTETVKKAVKTAAAKKPAPKKTATAAKKAAPKKATATKTAARKTAKKPAAKKKATPKKRVKKPLTDEEKLQAKMRQLRVKALKEPGKHRKYTAINAFVSETRASKSSFAETIKAFRNLTPAELEHWNHVANQEHAARQAEYKAFIHSYTPEQIKIANNARSQLRKLLADKRKRLPPYTIKLVDDRQPKRASPPFPTFVRARFASGDYKNIHPTDAVKLAANEWKSLSAAEKQKYEDEWVARKDDAAAAA
ncbi:unnamed protein product [Alternaria burnsii]|nr:unnamed protein product [Alternaria burnsii]